MIPVKPEGVSHPTVMSPLHGWEVLSLQGRRCSMAPGPYDNRSHDQMLLTKHPRSLRYRKTKQLYWSCTRSWKEAAVVRALGYLARQPLHPMLVMVYKHLWELMSLML